MHEKSSGSMKKNASKLAKSYLFVCCVIVLQNLLFQKNSFKNNIRVSNSVYPDHSVSPDLGPNCLQMLSADDKSRCYQGKS